MDTNVPIQSRQAGRWLFVRAPGVRFTRDELHSLMHEGEDGKTRLYEALIEQTRAGAAPAGEGSSSLLVLLYDELRRLARARVGQLPPGQTLQATALVHEVWVRLSDRGEDEATSRRHFFAAASRAMRDILVEQARRKGAKKRGGADRGERVDEYAIADDVQLEFNIQREELLSLDALLDEFEPSYPRQAQVVMLRWFSGLGQKEVAALLDVTERTVERDWRFAKAWLFDRLRGGEGQA